MLALAAEEAAVEALPLPQLLRKWRRMKRKRWISAVQEACLEKKEAVEEIIKPTLLCTLTSSNMLVHHLDFSMALKQSVLL